MSPAGSAMAMVGIMRMSGLDGADEVAAIDAAIFQRQGHRRLIPDVGAVDLVGGPFDPSPYLVAASRRSTT